MTFRLCKIIPALLCAAVLFSVCSVCAAAGNLPGDADGDGSVTLTDATCVQRKLAGLRTDGSFSETAADVDGNGLVEIADATLIQRWLAGMEPPYPIGPQPTQAPTQMPTDEEGWGTIIFRP